MRRNIFRLNKRGINPEYSHPSTPHISKSPGLARKSRPRLQKRNNKSFDQAVSQFYTGKRRIHQSQNIRPLFNQRNPEKNPKAYRSLTGKEIMEKMIREAKEKRIEEIQKNRNKLMEIEALRKRAEERVEYHKMIKEKEENIRSKSNHVKRRNVSNRVRPWRTRNKTRSPRRGKRRPGSFKLKPIKDKAVLENVNVGKKQKFKTLKIQKKGEFKQNGEEEKRETEGKKVKIEIIHPKKKLTGNIKLKGGVKRFSTFKSKSENPSLSLEDEIANIKQEKKISSLPMTSDLKQYEEEELKTPPSEGQSYMSHAQTPQVYPQRKFKKRNKPKIETQLDQNILNTDERKMNQAMKEVQKMIYLEDRKDNKIDKETVKFFMSKKKSKNEKKFKNVKNGKKDKKVSDEEMMKEIIEGNKKGSYLKRFKKKKGASQRKRVKKKKPKKTKEGQKKMRGKGNDDKVNNIIIKESYVHPPSDTVSDRNNVEGEKKRQVVDKDKPPGKIQVSMLEFQKLEKMVKNGHETPTFENLDRFKEEEKEGEKIENFEKENENIREEKIEEEKIENEDKGEVKEQERPESPKEKELEDPFGEPEKSQKSEPDEVEDPFGEPEKSQKSEPDEVEDPFGEPEKSNSEKEDEVEDPFGSTKKSLSMADSELALSKESNIKLELNMNQDKEKQKEVNQTPMNSSGQKTPEIDINQKDFVKKDEPIEPKNKKNKRKIDISKKSKRPKNQMKKAMEAPVKPIKKKKKEEEVKESVVWLDDGKSEDEDKIKPIMIKEDDEDDF